MSAIGSTTLDRTSFDTGVSERLDDLGSDLDPTGWWCVETDPFNCPAEGCEFIALYMTAAHRIIVWPERDDQDLLHHAGLARRAGRNPRVVEYERGFGPYLTYAQFEAIGRPVHGVQRDRPEGWPTS